MGANVGLSAWPSMGMRCRGCWRPWAWRVASSLLASKMLPKMLGLTRCQFSLALVIRSAGDQKIQLIGKQLQAGDVSEDPTVEVRRPLELPAGVVPGVFISPKRLPSTS